MIFEKFDASKALFNKFSKTCINKLLSIRIFGSEDQILQIFLIFIFIFNFKCTVS